MISDGVLITVYLVKGRKEARISKTVYRQRHDEYTQFYDMWMTKQLKIFNLALDPSLHVATDEFLACNDLESDLLAGAAMHGQLDLSEAPFSESFDNIVCADTLLGAHFISKRGLGPVVGGHDGGIHRTRVLIAGTTITVSACAADLGWGERYR